MKHECSPCSADSSLGQNPSYSNCSAHSSSVPGTHETVGPMLSLASEAGSKGKMGIPTLARSSRVAASNKIKNSVTTLTHSILKIKLCCFIWQFKRRSLFHFFLLHECRQRLWWAPPQIIMVAWFFKWMTQFNKMLQKCGRCLGGREVRETQKVLRAACTARKSQMS